MTHDNDYMRVYMKPYREKWQALCFDMNDFFTRHAPDFMQFMSDEEILFMRKTFDDIELAKKRKRKTKVKKE